MAHCQLSLYICMNQTGHTHMNTAALSTKIPLLCRTAAVWKTRASLSGLRTSYKPLRPAAWKTYGSASRTVASASGHFDNLVKRPTDDVDGREAGIVPLCELPGIHASALWDVLAWRSRAIEEINEIGDKFLLEDGGPSAEDLKVELGWLLEDSVAMFNSADNKRLHFHDQSIPGEAWRAALAWSSKVDNDRLGHVSKTVAGKSAGLLEDPWRSSHVHLRTSLADLARLWSNRTSDRAPLAYLTGSVHWRDTMLVVAPGTLIPRPETSELADLVLHLVTSDPTLASSAWADLGTGSGALAVALARELPGTAPVWALDSNPRAAALARLNARRLGVHDRVRVIEGSWDDPLENHLGSGALSGIVSNPPYVIRGHVTQAEVADHEPASALYGGGRDGGDCLRAVINAARELLKWNGVLALETGGGEQADALSDWMHGEGGYDQIMVSEDSSGARRFLTARYVGRRAA